MNKKVIVSHPGKQYVHQMLFALQQNNRLQLFITSIWYKPSSLLYSFILKIPLAGKFIYNKFLKKKFYTGQQDDRILQYPFYEIKRQLLVQFSVKYRLEKYVFEVEKAHDKYVAGKLSKLKPDVFIGYEKSSLESFKIVKQQGGTTVLDLAQVHYKYLIELSETQETFTNLFEDQELFDAINKVKAEEYKYADYILTLSEFAKWTLMKFGIEEQKVKVVSLGYNPQIFMPKKDYSRKKGLKLVYSGTFTRRKGIHLLLMTLAELNISDIELTVIGPLLDGEDLLKEFKGLFTYYDFLHHEELVKHLQAADVYVFPSFLDSWAMTVIEAMGCGLPVIVTQNTGAKDAVRNGETGFIIPVNDKERLKETILYFYNQKSEVERMGKNAASAALGYTWQQYYNQINKIVDQISN